MILSRARHSHWTRNNGHITATKHIYKTTTALTMTTTTTTHLQRTITTITAKATSKATAASHTSTCTSCCLLKTEVEKGYKGSVVPHTQALPCVSKESVDNIRQHTGSRQCRIQFTWRQC